MIKKLQTVLCLAVIAGFITLWGVSDKKNLSVMTSTDSISSLPDKQIVVLDPGHGGADGGCVAYDGTVEKQINLAVSNNLRDMLIVLGYDVKCTRTEDISIHDKDVKGLGNQKKSDMKNRLALFNKYTNAIAVSIHQNKFTDEKYSGAQMFYSEKNKQGEHLADIMQKRFVAFLQPENTRETKAVGNELYLLDNTSCPSVMAECGFLSNKEEAQKLEDPDYQKKVSFTLLTGITEFTNEKVS